MRRFSLFPSFTFPFLLLLASCISTPGLPTPVGPTVTYDPFAAPSPTPFAPPTSPPTPLPTAAFTPTVALPTMTVAPPPGPRPRYTLRAVLDYARHGLSADERIFYRNSTGSPLSALVLAVEPNRQEDCFSLVNLSGERVSGYSLDGARLEVWLDPPLAASEALEFSIRFDLSLPPADHSHVFGYKPAQFNLVDWYPFIVPFRDDWVLHEPGKVGEHLVYEAADFDVTLTPTGAAGGLTIAAPGARAGDNFRLEAARTFSASISDRFLSSSKMAGGVPVTSYYFAGEKIQGERVLDEAALALETYQRLFGPYPYPALALVETDFNDGMESDGLVFLGRNFYLQDDGTKLNYLIALTAHETAHQWWFGRVGSDQALEPWLDEALSTYSEILFYEQNYPGVAEAWWPFRVENLSPQGFVDVTIYDTDNHQTYAKAVYLRGALFLRDLRARIGDEAFFAFLQDYASQWDGKIATAGDFFRILAPHANTNLSDLLGEYFTP